MKKTKSATPCLGICSTTYGDDVCRGCKRFVHEVINWTSYTEDEKVNVNSRLESFKLTVLKEKFSIFDAGMLAEQLQAYSINFNDSLDPLSWIFDLLRASGSQDLDIAKFGVSINSGYSHYSLGELKDLINKELFELSQAHYDRYFSIWPPAAR